MSSTTTEVVGSSRDVVGAVVDGLTEVGDVDPVDELVEVDAVVDDLSTVDELVLDGVDVVDGADVVVDNGTEVVDGAVDVVDVSSSFVEVVDGTLELEDVVVSQAHAGRANATEQARATDRLKGNAMDKARLMARGLGTGFLWL